MIEKVTIEEQFAGERIDKALALANDAWSRSQVATWIDEKRLTVNGAEVKAKYKVKVGDVVEIDIPEPEDLEVVAEDLNLEIVYEDADVLVVNKPRGMVVHPAPDHMTGT